MHGDQSSWNRSDEMPSDSHTYALKQDLFDRSTPDCAFILSALSEAGQVGQDSPQVGPQLTKLPTCVSFVTSLAVYTLFHRSSLPEDDIRSKYMTVPVKPPEVRAADLYKLPKRAKKQEQPGEEGKR